MDMTAETFANDWFSATFHWQDGLLTAIDLSGDRRPATPPRSPFGAELARIVADYGRLEEDVWPELPMNWNGLSAFSILALDNLRRRVPRGAFTTYGQLAAMCGSPRAARAVGSVMARNRWPLLYPCHRVLAANLGLGGFGPGLPLKQTLLTLEKARPLE